MGALTILTYPGSKNFFASFLTAFIPKGSRVVCSPFSGGASFELSLLKLGIVVRCNDISPGVSNFWNVIKTRRKEFYQSVICLLPVTREVYNYISAKMYCWKELDSLTFASYFFILSCTSFAGFGHIRKSGYLQKHSETAIFKKIKALKKIDFTNFSFDNVDYSEMLSENDCFTFLDPPYYVDKIDRTYAGYFTKQLVFDHKRLKTLLEAKSNWMMTYNDHDYIRQLYEGYIIINIEGYYSSSRKMSKQILIFSKDTDQERVANIYSSLSS